jgi:hypothetical protein
MLPAGNLTLLPLPRRRTFLSAAWCFVGIILVTVVALVILSFTPLMSCPSCGGLGVTDWIVCGIQDESYKGPKGCDACSKKGRISMLQNWSLRKAQPAQ